MLRSRRKRRAFLEEYDRRLYDGYYPEEESLPPVPVVPVEPLEAERWRERVPRFGGEGGSLLYFLLGVIAALLLALILVRAATGGQIAGALKKPTAKHIEVERDERGRIRGITTFYEYD